MKPKQERCPNCGSKRIREIGEISKCSYCKNEFETYPETIIIWKNKKCPRCDGILRKDAHRYDNYYCLECGYESRIG